MKNNLILGVGGEVKAVKFLKKSGYKILEKNYKNKLGEIDVICYNKAIDEIVFVEVKSRNSTEFGLPCEAVNFHKQNKIKMVANLYLLQKHKLESKSRFDVIEVLNDNINHIKYAL